MQRALGGGGKVGVSGPKARYVQSPRSGWSSFLFSQLSSSVALGMAASASGSARDEVLAKEVELECGDISASQEDLLARSSFLGGGGQEEKKQQGGQDQDQGGEEEEDAITMCTLPFTQSPSPCSSSESKMKTKQPRKPRVCTRKVRGARIRSPSPDRRNSNIVDPLCRAVLMIPTTPPAAAAPTGDLLASAASSSSKLGDGK